MENALQHRVRLVIFDFDGTIADTRLNIVLTMRETMRELRLPEVDEAACAATIGLRLKDGFGRLLPSVPPASARAASCGETPLASSSRRPAPTPSR